MSVVSTGAAAAVRVMERRVAEAAAPVAQPDPQATLFSLRDPSLHDANSSGRTSRNDRHCRFRRRAGTRQVKTPAAARAAIVLAVVTNAAVATLDREAHR